MQHGKNNNVIKQNKNLRELQLKGNFFNLEKAFFFFKTIVEKGRWKTNFPRKATIKVDKIDKNHFGVLEIDQRGERKGGHKLPVSGMKQGLSLQILEI